MAFDTRQIQTAVLDGPDSYEPVVCPTDADELDAFRTEYADRGFFCGEQLGGCGGELRTRRPGDRVCHFFHVHDPSRPPCGRRERTAGVASADHLYILKTTRSWLRRQGRDPKYRFTERDTAPPGSLIDISGQGVNLRFHTDPALPLDWGTDEGAELVLGPNVRVDAATLVRRGYVNRFMLRSQGSARVLLFRTVFPEGGSEWFPLESCEITSDGRLRTPALEGFVPPVPQTCQAGDTSVADLQPRGPVQIGDLVRLLTAGRRGGQVRAVRGLVEAAKAETARCEGIALETLQTSLTQARAWLHEQDEHRRWVFRRLHDAVNTRAAGAAGRWLKQARAEIERGDDPTGEEAAILEAAEPLWNRWRARASQPPSRVQSRTLSWIPPNNQQPPAPSRPAPKAANSRADTTRAKQARRAARAEVTALLARLDAEASRMSAPEFDSLLLDLDQAVAAARHVTTRQRHDIARWKNTNRQPQQPGGRAVPAKPTAVRPRPDADRSSVRSQLPPSKLDAAAAAVRGALKKAARERTTTTWSRLHEQLGSALPRMTPTERLDVLVRVDQPTPADQPLLSALIAAGDPGFTARYRSVAAALGRETPADADEIRAAISGDVRQLHDLWRYQ